MTFVLFLLYAAIGGGVGYGVFTLTDVGMPLSIAAGGIATALLGQIHILIKSDRSTKEIDERIDRVERTVRDSVERVDVVEARTEAVEGDSRVDVFVGVDADHDSTAALVVVHACHCDLPTWVVTLAGRVDGTVMGPGEVRLP